MVSFFSSRVEFLINRSSKYIALVTGIFFLIFLHIAMYVYPGGFDLIHYFISDLGKVTANNGDPNPTSSLLFIIAMVLGGLSVFTFWIIAHKMLIPVSNHRNIIILGSILGLVSAPFMAAISFFHVDTQTNLHYTVGIIFFISISAAIIIYSLLIISQFFIKLKEYFRLFYIITSIIASVIFMLIIIGLIYIGIDPMIVIIIVYLLLVSILLLQSIYPNYIKFISFQISVFYIILITLILLLIAFAQEVSPSIEISFIYGIIIWLITHIIRVWSDIN